MEYLELERAFPALSSEIKAHMFKLLYRAVTVGKPAEWHADVYRRTGDFGDDEFQLGGESRETARIDWTAGGEDACEGRPVVIEGFYRPRGFMV